MKRFHVNLTVSDLKKSVDFYNTLFAVEPTVEKDDYAKWMLEDPRMNFAISNGHTETTGIEHVGIQVESETELEEIRQRIAQASELASFDEPETNCCYANSSKTWTKDPQNVIWETFHTMDQMKNYGNRPALDALEKPAPEPPLHTGGCC